MASSTSETDIAVPAEDTEWGMAIKQQALEQPETCSDDVIIEEEVDVAIVGGGLVGLAVAIGLTRNGINAKVYERAPQLRSISQGILAIQPNGMSALEKIHPELPKQVTSVGCERWQFVHTVIQENGTITETTSNTGDECLSKYGRVKVGLTWVNMQQVLASLLPSNVVVTSRPLTFFEELDDSVLLHFQTAESSFVVKARAVLACDGVFSAARRQMFPEDRPIYFGQLNWGTVISTHKLPPGMHPPNAVHYINYNGTPRWMSMLNDGGGGQTFWQFRVADPVKSMALSGNKGRGGLGLPGVKAALLPVAKPSADVSAALERIPESQIFERSIVGRSTLPTWLSAGKRVALVGDAAHGMHPNIAQGANSAFESAAAVVEAMVAQSKIDSNWKAALGKYEEGRKPRADVVQRFANMLGITQATGKEFLSPEVTTDMIEWILHSDPQREPPAEAVKYLQTFDPCSQPGVSLL